MSSSTTSDHSQFRPRDYLSLKHWPTWVLFAKLWLLTRLPLPAQLWLGRRCGDLLRLVHKKRRQITLTNLALCYPDKNNSELDSLLQQAFQSFGMGLFEMASLWFRKPEFLLRHCTFEGLEHLRAARDSGTGIILLQAHFTTLELGANLIATKIPLEGNYDPPKNPLFADFLLDRRLQYVNSMVDNRNARHMVRLLKSGACLWYSPDQHVRVSDGGLRTRFFAQDVLTVGGASRMARLSNALVIPYLSTRDSQHCRYTLRVFPPLADFPGDSVLEDTQRINDTFEAQIRNFPAQYFWLHKRFKQVDDGAPDHYR